jgi:hypothetical protein
MFFIKLSMYYLGLTQSETYRRKPAVTGNEPLNLPCYVLISYKCFLAVTSISILILGSGSSANHVVFAGFAFLQ